MTPTDATPPGQPEGTLEALRELSERATPGPWRYGDRCLYSSTENRNLARASVNYVRTLLSRDPAPPAAGELRTTGQERRYFRGLPNEDSFALGPVFGERASADIDTLLATTAAQAATIAELRAELERAITLASDFQNWRDFLKARAEKAEAALAAATARPERATVSETESGQ